MHNQEMVIDFLVRFVYIWNRWEKAGEFTRYYFKQENMFK